MAKAKKLDLLMTPAHTSNIIIIGLIFFVMIIVPELLFIFCMLANQNISIDPTASLIERSQTKCEYESIKINSPKKLSLF